MATEGDVIKKKNSGDLFLVTCTDYMNEGYIDAINLSDGCIPDDVFLDDLDSYINLGPIMDLINLPKEAN